MGIGCGALSGGTMVLAGSLHESHPPAGLAAGND
jgi:hypothetical protein